MEKTRETREADLELGVGRYISSELVFLPALVESGSFICAIFCCLLTLEVEISLCWLRFARSAPFNIKMKTGSL